MNSTPKKLYVKTYGCQMNVYDSDRMAQLLRLHGYEMTDTPKDANISIVNTCHIREKATEKVFSELGRLKKNRQAKRDKGEEGLLVVAGCVAQAEGQEIMRRASYVDVVIGPQSYHELPEMIEKAKRATPDSERKDLVKTEFPLVSKFDSLPLPDANAQVSTFLSIQEGCDKFCTYCVVPYTRGAEFSRPITDVVNEAKHLVAQGIKEITLLGQNVTAYHGKSPSNTGEWGVGALCLELANIEGLDRIRYTTSHPRDMDQELANVHGSCPKLMPLLHLPVQSGSDRILKAMNRQHTADHYRDIIAMFREACPQMAFSSDFIVGFPGESEKDFEETMQLVKDIDYALAYSFKYSRRPGTPASVMDLQVPVTVQGERLQRLQALLNEQQIRFNEKMIGTSIPVLFEKSGTKKNQLIGKSPYMQGVHVESDCDIIGSIKNVKITEAGFKSLKGTVS
jgi:tRNA-2-methylthio-N6-dimethylallyladenosine synthase